MGPQPHSEMSRNAQRSRQRQDQRPAQPRNQERRKPLTGEEDREPPGSQLTQPRSQTRSSLPAELVPPDTQFVQLGQRERRMSTPASSVEARVPPGSQFTTATAALPQQSRPLEPAGFRSQPARIFQGAPGAAAAAPSPASRSPGMDTDAFAAK